MQDIRFTLLTVNIIEKVGNRNLKRIANPINLHRIQPHNYIFILISILIDLIKTENLVNKFQRFPIFNSKIYFLMDVVGCESEFGRVLLEISVVRTIANALKHSKV